MNDLKYLDDATEGAAVGQGLAYWSEVFYQDNTFGMARLAEMTRQPRFADACRRYISDLQSIVESNAELARMFIDIDRMFLGFFILYLNARGGITHTSIKAFCKDIGLASPGRATTILVALRVIGYIIPDPVQHDRRSRRYVLSTRHRGNCERFIRQNLEAVSLVEPAASAVAGRVGDPVVFDAFVTSIGDGLATSIKRGDQSAISLFDRRNAGLGILYRLASSGHPDDAFPPRRPVPISINALANEFGVSRAHVRKLLTDAETKGYMRRNADASTLTLEEPLRTALADYLAAHLMAFAHGAYQALRAIGEAP